MLEEKTITDSAESLLSEGEEKEIERYPEFLNRYYRKVIENAVGWRKYMMRYVQEGDQVLEGGCSRISYIRQNGFHGFIVGIDIIEASIRRNQDLNCGAMADLGQLPFQDETFNVIHLGSVVEHLEHPETVFHECHRVLKKDGFLILNTMCVYNPIMAFNAFLPLKVRIFIKERILKIGGISLDTFPAYYRCNSPGKINKMMHRTGFSKKHFRMIGLPITRANLAFYALFLLYERITDFKWLRIFKHSFAACYSK